MALLDTAHSSPHSMYSNLIQNAAAGYPRNNYYYEQDLARLNLQQRLHSSPEQMHYDLHARFLVSSSQGVKEERALTDHYQATAFKPYSSSVSPDQENVPQHANQQSKVGIIEEKEIH